jgi:hypothetical protein
MPRLDLRIVGARGLKDTQMFGKIDPYCTVSLEGKQWRTKVAENTTEPEWNEVFKFNIADADSSRLHFVVWDHNTMSDDFLGEYHLSIAGLDRGEVVDKWVLLSNCKGNAELHIRLLAVDFGDIDENDRHHETPPHPEYRPMPQGYQYPPPGQPGGAYPGQQQQQQQQQYPPQGYPQQQGGYPPQGYPPQQGGYPPQGYQQQQQQHHHHHEGHQQQQWNSVEQFYGRPIRFRNLAHGTRLRGFPGGEGSKVDMQSNAPAQWESWFIEPIGHGKVHIRSAHGTLLRAHPGGDRAPVDLQSNQPAEWERWEIIPANGGFHLKSHHNLWLRAQAGGEGAHADQAPVPQAWEVWAIEYAQ